MSDWEHIAGDLTEEYALYVRPERGRWRAAWWLGRQMLRSIGPMFFDRETVATALLFFLLPMTLVDALWTYILSHVPLKADSVRSFDQLLAVLAVEAMLIVALRQITRRPQLILLACAIVSLSCQTGERPLWFVAAFLALPLLPAPRRESSRSKTV
jgi:hypothetical protein